MVLTFNMIYYKIRSKTNPDLFRKADGTWNKSGKVYDTLGKLRTTITLNMNSYSEYVRDKVKDWEIVEYEVRVKEVKHLADVIDPKKIFELLGK
jgi:hypothetical protein